MAKRRVHTRHVSAMGPDRRRILRSFIFMQKPAAFMVPPPDNKDEKDESSAKEEIQEENMELQIQPVAQASPSSAQGTSSSSSSNSRQAIETSLAQATKPPVPPSPIAAPSTPEADLERASQRRRLNTPERSSAVKRPAEDSPDEPSAQVVRRLEDDFTDSLQTICVVSSKRGESEISIATAEEPETQALQDPILREISRKKNLQPE